MSKIGKKERNILILRSPRVTEKSTTLGEKNSYVFVVDKQATKTDIKLAISDKYKVIPKKIGIINLPAKKTFRRGIYGQQSGVKKAVVYLKSGDKIEVI